MTNVTIEQAVKGYLVFSAKEGKLFREGRSYLAGKTYHNRYLAIYEKLEDAVVNASQYPSEEGITIYEVSGWGQVTDFGKCKVTEWLKLDQIVAKKEWVALLGKQTSISNSTTYGRLPVNRIIGANQATSDARGKPEVRWLTVDDESAGQRLDNFLLGQLKGAPRSLVYKLVRSGQVRPGQHVMLEGVGGGFTWGAVLLKM